MTTYKWLLFDADETLFDYKKAEKSALANTFEQLGYPFEPLYLPEYQRINGQIWLDFEQGKIAQDKLKTRRFELLFEALNIHSDPQEFSDKYLVNLSKATYLIDGAEEIVKALHGKFDIAIITNGLTAVQKPQIFKVAAITGSTRVGLILSGKVILNRSKVRLKYRNCVNWLIY